MKNLKIVALLMLFVSICTASRAQSKTETMKVSGNCGMCEKKIEAAAITAGATTAEWDKKAKILTVTYDASKTSNDAIQSKVAAVGYDTEKYTADMKVYKNLHECCQYENKRGLAGNK